MKEFPGQDKQDEQDWTAQGRKAEVQLASRKFNLLQFPGGGSASHPQFWVSTSFILASIAFNKLPRRALTLRRSEARSVNSRY